MRFSLRLALAIAVACTLGGSVAALAEPASYEVETTDDRPLMVIRFNQPHVTYERLLYTTVSRALEVKPTVMFEVVAVAVKARDSDYQQRNNDIAAQNAQGVMNSLNTMGLPRNRITLNNAMDNVSSSEVRIFVH